MLKHPWCVLIISVKEDESRRHHVMQLKHTLETYGFTVNIIDAIYYKTVNVADLLNQQQITMITNHWLAMSQAACFLSHRLAWQHVNTDYDIILEDDMTIDIDQFMVMEQDVVHVKQYDGIVMWKHPDKVPSFLTPLTNQFIQSYPQWGLCAYHVKPALAKQLLTIKTFDQPIDNIIYQHHFLNNVCFTKHDIFVNLGFLGGESNQPCQFKSLIYN